MIGYQQFVEWFGEITVLQVVEILLAITFLVLGYRKFKTYLIKKHEREEQKDKDVQEALTGVRNMPVYREQSLRIQTELKNENAGLRQTLGEVLKRLDKIEESQNQRDRNEVREKLIGYYRHYANPETNPSHSWTKMEAEAFRELFAEYEAKGGNGHMHTVVLPAMDMLTETEI